MAASAFQREALQEMPLAEFEALLDSATSCTMTIRDFRGSIIPIADEPSNLFEPTGYAQNYPVKNWRVFLAAHLQTGALMQPGTANRDTLTLRISPSTTQSPHREAVFAFNIPRLAERLAGLIIQ